MFDHSIAVFMILSRICKSVQIFSIDDANCSVSSGFISRKAFLLISEREALSVHKTGIPVDIASKTESPTPSSTDGKMHASEFAYKRGKFLCGKCPVTKISFQKGDFEIAL